MRKEKNELLRFIIGLGLLAAGIYWFTASVTVTTGFYSWRIGAFRAGGLVVVPLIVGVVWMFIDNESIFAKILSGLGMLLIIASVVMGTTFIFQRTNLYEYILMLIFIFGGLGLVLSVLLAKPKDRRTRDHDDMVRREDYDKLQDELNDLKKKYR